MISLLKIFVALVARIMQTGTGERDQKRKYAAKVTRLGFKPWTTASRIISLCTVTFVQLHNGAIRLIVLSYKIPPTPAKKINKLMS